VFFTVDPHDARELSAHTLPELDEHDLSHLDRYVAAARLTVDGREQPAFTLTTRQAPPIIGEATAIRQACTAHTPALEATPLETLARTMANRSRQRATDREQRHNTAAGGPASGNGGQPRPRRST
jgi:hypothetical protein